MIRRALLLLAILVVLIPPTSAKDKYQQPGPIRSDRNVSKWADKTLHRLSLEEKVGQLFMIPLRVEFMNAKNPEYLRAVHAIHQYHLGGFVMTVRFDAPFLYKTEAYETATVLNRLQQESKIPLIIAADFERGASMRLNGATPFPHAMAFGAAGKPEYAEAFGRITSEESRAIGVHWNFFPVADVNSNPDNPIINTRSFGGDPAQVGKLVAAYIRGAHAGGLLTTAKHFPGHGDTASDSHLGVAQVKGDLHRLETVELPPFQQAIQSGVDAVMTAHVTVPALEPDPNRVATTSPAVITTLLKQKLGFRGLTVTDALDMRGLTDLYLHNIGRAAVDAFKAGNDVLIYPADLDASYRALLEAARSGEIPAAQLDGSVRKILETKASLGLDKAKLVDTEKLPERVGNPENLAVAQQIADDSITLVRNNGKILPLAKKAGTNTSPWPYQGMVDVHNGVVLIVFSDDVRTESGRVLERQVRSRVPDANVIYVDARLASGVTEQVLRSAREARAVIVAVEVIPTAGKMEKVAGSLRNSVSLPHDSGALLQRVLDAAPERTIVATLGNPYLATEFPSIQNYLCAYSNATVSEISVAKALFGEIPIRGHLPVRIPGVAERGAGAMVDFRAAAGATSHAN